MTTSSRVFPFEKLKTAGLRVDALYEGGRQGHTGDDPISRLVGTGNQGGFRFVGSIADRVRLCVLYSSLSDLDWPDELDPTTGLFTYYGDNKRPGHSLHDTHGRGNRVLQQSFNALHLGQRHLVPPFFIFTRGHRGRDVYFRGLAVPGAQGMSSNEDLVAVWRTNRGQRFQNYRATFTILDVPAVQREWLADLHAGNPLSVHAPDAWIGWVERGEYVALRAPSVVEYRTPVEQLPPPGVKSEIVQLIVEYFRHHPRGE
jgi:hypothetical protein